MQARHTFTDQPQTVEPDPSLQSLSRLRKKQFLMTEHHLSAVGGEARSEGGEPEAFGVR